MFCQIPWYFYQHHAVLSNVFNGLGGLWWQRIVDCCVILHILATIDATE